MINAIWVTWENQIRNRSMAANLGAKLYVFMCGGNRYIRYLVCMYKTFLTLLKEKPDIVFTQNPSIVLNFFLILARVFFRFKLVSDAHYAGITAYNGSRILQKALDLCNIMVDLVIVTNAGHAKHVTDIGGKAIISEDPLPDIERFNTNKPNQDKLVLFICSFDFDEPYQVAFKAADLLANDNFVFMATGNFNKVGINQDEHPSVKFLGYLPETEFYATLYRSSIVLDLTESENCLVCGAYEAMVAEKPLVTSDTACLRKYFVSGTLFTEHDEFCIANTIKSAYQNSEYLKNEIKEWKKIAYKQQVERFENIRTVLGLGG